MAGLAGAYLAYCDCTRKATEREDADRGRVHRRRSRQPDGRPQRHLLRPPGPRLGRDDHQDRRQPDQRAPGVLGAVQEVRAAARGAGRQARRRRRRRGARRCCARRGHRDGATSATPSRPRPKKIDVGTVAALGVAVGAIGTFITALIGYATGSSSWGRSPWWARSSALMLLISLPSVVLAYLKLRKRNLGPILDANGWAVNARAKINMPFGATLTAWRAAPRLAARFDDRYADGASPGRPSFLGRDRVRRLPLVPRPVRSILARVPARGARSRLIDQPVRAR